VAKEKRKKKKEKKKGEKKKARWDTSLLSLPYLSSRQLSPRAASSSQEEVHADKNKTGRIYGIYEVLQSCQSI
jgi:hypothetical protein